MTDFRRPILWAILGFSLVMLWDRWQVHEGQQATVFPWPTRATATAPAATLPPHSGLPPSLVPGDKATVAANAATAGVPEPIAGAPASSRQLVTVTTDVMRVTFDAEGASVIRTELLKHAGDRQTGKTTTPFALLDRGPSRFYVAQSGLVGGDFPNHRP